MIPEGTYKSRGTEGALGYASTETEQIAVDLVFLEGGPEVEGQHLTWYGFFTEKTTERTLESLRLLGWVGDDLSDLTGIDQNEVYVKVTHEEDQNGNLRARAAWINASGGLAMKERMDEGAAKAFAQRMRGHVLAQKQRTKGVPETKPAANSGVGQGKRPAAAPPPKRQQRAAPAEEVNDDDIPF